MSHPAYYTIEEFQNRKEKLAEIRALGIEPYPCKFTPDSDSKSAHETYTSPSIGDSAAAEAGTTPQASFAGRLVLFRAMGKNAFAQLQDHTGRIQVMFNRDKTTVKGYTPSGEEALSPLKFIEKKIDLGDLLGVEGNLFYTGKGELTLFVKQVTLLCKTLLPLADKHSGLADKELRYRKRWLDLITNPEVGDRFRLRSAMLRFIRDYLESQQFIEVETPVLQSIYGGAQASPFKTRLNALDQEMFLRISLEIPLKKLIVGGMHRIFEIGKAFRNEGMDRTHNPEFTMLEAYAAYWDYNDMMVLVENLFEGLAKKLFGKTKIPVLHGEQIVEVELAAPWKRISMKDSLREYASIDFDNSSDETLKAKLNSKGVFDPKEVAKWSRGILLLKLFEEFVEDKLIQPHHITDHPVESTPLCKLHRNPAERSQGIVERFESFVLGGEICNAYTELNDPELQRTLLEEQAAKKDAGDEEANPLDEEFIEAICQGMPPTGGVGIGIDRLVMLLTNSASIRDVLYFPWMKPMHSQES